MSQSHSTLLRPQTHSWNSRTLGCVAPSPSSAFSTAQVRITKVPDFRSQLRSGLRRFGQVLDGLHCILLTLGCLPAQQEVVSVEWCQLMLGSLFLYAHDEVHKVSAPFHGHSKISKSVNCLCAFGCEVIWSRYSSLNYAAFRFHILPSTPDSRFCPVPPPPKQETKKTGPRSISVQYWNAPF